MILLDIPNWTHHELISYREIYLETIVKLNGTIEKIDTELARRFAMRLHAEQDSQLLKLEQEKP